MNTKLDIKAIGLITTFEKITRSHVKTVFFDKTNQIVFIVKEGEAGKAIGKGGSNIKRLSALMKKKVKAQEKKHKEGIESYEKIIKEKTI